MNQKNVLQAQIELQRHQKKIKSDIYINVQGDEPTIKPNDIKKIINAKIKFQIM